VWIVKPIAPEPLSDHASSTSKAAHFAEKIVQQWRNGARPDAQAVFYEHPSLLQHKSIVINIAYEEYCLRERGGEALDIDEFCARLPAFRSSIRSVILAHRLLADNPSFLTSENAPWPEAGESVEELTIVEEFARGGFARVYLAFDRTASRPCVLKLSLAPSPEGPTLGPLNHRHITPLLWNRAFRCFSAVCLPLLAVSTLEDVIEAAFQQSAAPRLVDALFDRLDDDRALIHESASETALVHRGDAYVLGIAIIASRIADALAYVHERGLSHGDLKLSNVVLSPNAHPFLIDFNLAGSGSRRVVRGGTLPFMAPESLRALSEQTELDVQKADIFSFGVMLYEMLVGTAPWQVAAVPQEDAVRRVLEAQEANPNPSNSLLQTHPLPVVTLLQECLQFDPISRPTAAELCDRLKKWISSRQNRGDRVKKRFFATCFLLVSFSAIGAIAWASFKESDSTVASADRAVDPQDASEFFARGMERLNSKNAASALVDFERAQFLQAHHRNLAYQAYCLNLMANPMAIDKGKEAIAAGSSSAAVRNNIGSAFIQNGQYGLALTPLNEALEIEPTMRAARYNRAIALFESDPKPNKRLSTLTCISDIKAVLASKPSSAEAYYIAASMFAAGSPLDPSLTEIALDALDEAYKLGENPQKFAREPLLAANLSSNARFKEFASKRRITTPKAENLRLVQPE